MAKQGNKCFGLLHIIFFTSSRRTAVLKLKSPSTAVTSLLKFSTSKSASLITLLLAAWPNPAIEEQSAHLIRLSDHVDKPIN